MEEDGHTSQGPLGRLLLGLEVEGPHVGWTAGLGLVDGTGVHVAQVLLVHRNRLKKFRVNKVAFLLTDISLKKDLKGTDH